MRRKQRGRRQRWVALSCRVPQRRGQSACVTSSRQWTTQVRRAAPLVSQPWHAPRCLSCPSAVHLISGGGGRSDGWLAVRRPRRLHILPRSLPRLRSRRSRCCSRGRGRGRAAHRRHTGQFDDVHREVQSCLHVLCPSFHECRSLPLPSTPASRRPRAVVAPQPSPLCSRARPSTSRGQASCTLSCAARHLHCPRAGKATGGRGFTAAAWRALASPRRPPLPACSDEDVTAHLDWHGWWLHAQRVKRAALAEFKRLRAALAEEAAKARAAAAAAATAADERPGGGPAPPPVSPTTRAALAAWRAQREAAAAAEREAAHQAEAAAAAAADSRRAEYLAAQRAALAEWRASQSSELEDSGAGEGGRPRTTGGARGHSSRAGSSRASGDTAGRLAPTPGELRARAAAALELAAARHDQAVLREQDAAAAAARRPVAGGAVGSNRSGSRVPAALTGSSSPPHPPPGLAARARRPAAARLQSTATCRQAARPGCAHHPAPGAGTQAPPSLTPSPAPSPRPTRRGQPAPMQPASQPRQSPSSSAGRCARRHRRRRPLRLSSRLLLLPRTLQARESGDGGAHAEPVASLNPRARGRSFTYGVAAGALPARATPAWRKGLA